MSNLSEEEIIEKIKHLIKSSNDRTDLLNYLDEKTKKSLQGLLDLYQQEKEKNKELKELIEQNLKYSHNLEKDLFENCSNYVVSKDVIQEMINERKFALQQNYEDFENDIELQTLIKILDKEE